MIEKSVDQTVTMLKFIIHLSFFIKFINVSFMRIYSCVNFSDSHTMLEI